MPTILFVCTANQFRSPIAAACFDRKLRDERCAGEWRVLSAGTWAPPGLPAHPIALQAAAARGLDLLAHTTREVDASILSAADLIVVMTHNHREALLAEFPDVAGKMHLLGELAGIPGGEIPDPAEDNFAKADAIVRLVCDSVDKAFAAVVQFAECQGDAPAPPPLNTPDSPTALQTPCE